MGLADYEEYVDVESISRPRARKTYECVECGGKIEPGDKYRRDFQAVDGCGSTFIMCRECDDLTGRFHEAAKGLDLTFYYGGLRSAIRELHHEFDRQVPGYDYPPRGLDPS